MSQNLELRRCLREPIPEIFDVARYLDAAVSAHSTGHKDIAEELFHLANCEIVREWLNSVWGANSPYVQYRPVPDAPQILPKELRVNDRMPTSKEKKSFMAEMAIIASFAVFLSLEKRSGCLYQRNIPRPCHGVKQTISSTQHFKLCGHNTITSYPMLGAEIVCLITSF